MVKVWSFTNMSIAERKNWLTDHFAYEIDGIVTGFKGVLPVYTTYRDPSAPDDKTITLSLKLFLLHARNLIGFFYSKGGNYADNARASDYTQDAAWETLLMNKRAYLHDTEFPQISKYLAHLAYSRMQSRGWPCLKIYNEIIELTEAFLNAVTKQSQYKGAKLKKFRVQISKYKLTSPPLKLPLQQYQNQQSNNQVIICKRLK